jgi:arsenate reductase (thioredoxin)
MKQRVLFLCTGNSARSQMAEGILRHLAGDRFEVHSAGTKPSVVNPHAITAMRELGIDISAHRSKHVDECFGKPMDTVITVCDHAKETCPIFPGVQRQLHWSFADPAAATGTADEKLAVFRTIRDQIHARIQNELLKSA